MRRLILFALLALAAFNAVAATKDSGPTTLKDVQPVGTLKDKHQQYDISFVSITGKSYVCRTAETEKVKATDLVVGSSVTYQLKGDKGKVRTSSGKQFSCTVVRVAEASDAARQ